MIVYPKLPQSGLQIRWKGANEEFQQVNRGELHQNDEKSSF